MANKIAKTNQERSAARRRHENDVALACGFPTVRKLLTAMIVAQAAGFAVAVVIHSEDGDEVQLSDAAELVKG